MIVEFGNHAAPNGLDDAPKVTTVHVPEADEHGQGGYSHKPKGVSVDDFRAHRQEATDFRGGITSLPDHEALLAITNAWPSQAAQRPAWVQVTPHELTPKGHAQDIEKFLSAFYGDITIGAPGNLEDTHWTRFGPPGQGGPVVPDHKALFTNNGRVIANVNDGGGQVGATGQATASTATTLTTASTYTLNQWAGYRVYATVSATVMVFGNVVSNTAGANSVLTVDRWYAVATPGGVAGSTPSATATFLIADGGGVSAWFVGLATGANAPAAADTTLSTNGNVEYNTGGAGRGYVRKIAPYAQTSGVATRSLTLTPVFTGDGSDTYPQTFTTIGVFTSMVIGTVGTMKFETALSASATVAASADQITITETISGS